MGSTSDHDLLLRNISRYFTDPYALDLLGRLLGTWSATNASTGGFGHGLPQGPEASAFLADMFLFSLDKQMADLPGGAKYIRYVDDMRIFCQSEREA